MKKLFLLCSFLLVTGVSFGQLVASYGFNAFSDPFVSIAGSGTAAVNNSFSDDDGFYNQVPIGFAFSYNGNSYNTISVSTNGWAALGQTATADRFHVIDNSTGSNLPRPILAPLWTDLYTQADNVVYQTTGAPGSQVFTIQWTGSDHFDDFINNFFVTPLTDFQIVLYEGTNIVEFRYNIENTYDSGPDGGSCVIGISGGDGPNVAGIVDYLSLSDESASPTASSTTVTSNLTAQPASNQVYQFTPPPACSGAPTAGTIVAGTTTACLPFSTTLTLTGNTLAIGITYQWQSSTDGVTFVPIPGANVSSYTTTVSTDSFFNCIVTCSNTSQSDVTPSQELSVTGPTISASAVGGGACPGQPVTLNGSTNAPNFSWDGPGGFSESTDMNPVIASPVAGIYTFTATNPTCTFTRTVSVTVLPGPLPFTITPSSATVCGGGSQLLTTPGTLAHLVQTFASGTIDIPVPSSGTIGNQTSVLNISGIPAGAVITGIDVNFDVTHTFDGDLTFNIAAPDGNILNLVRTEGSLNDNFTNTTVSSTGSNTFSSGTAPYTGIFAADAFNGVGTPGFLSNVTTWPPLYTTANGNWTLAINDGASGDNGTLHHWSIILYYDALPDYTWSPALGLFNDAGLTSGYTAGTATPNVYAAAANTYTATATIGTCTQTATATITTGPDATVNITGPAANICSGTSTNILFSGAPGTVASYHVTVAAVNGPTQTVTLDGTGNFNLATGPLTAATCYVLEMGVNGVCSLPLSASACVGIDAAPAAVINNFGSTTICTNGSDQMQGDAPTAPPGGLVGAGYQWLRADTILSGQTTGFYNADTAGDYKVIIFYNALGAGCLDTSDATTLTVLPIPVAVVTPAGPFEFCIGGGILLDGTNAAAVSYQWLRTVGGVSAPLSSTGTNATYNADSSGIYQVIVGNGACFDTSSGTLVIVDTLPVVAITGSTTICSGDSTNVTFTGSAGAAIAFTISDGTTTTNAFDTLDATGSFLLNTHGLTAQTTYHVLSATNPITSCTQLINTPDVIIGINALPTATVIGTATVCNGDNATVTFGGSANVIITYTTDGGVTTATIDPSVTSTLTLGPLTQDTTVAIVSAQDNITGCMTPIAGQSVTITVLPLPTAAVTALSVLVCSGDSTTITFTGTPNATVDYTVMDANGTTPGTATIDGTGSFSFNTGGLLIPTTYTLTDIALTGTPSCPQFLNSSVTVNINPLPTVLISSTGTEVCAGNGVNINFSGSASATGLSVAYTVNGQPDTIILTPAGFGTVNTGAMQADSTYTITYVMDISAGCSQPVSGQTILVTVDPLPTATISGGGVICNGDVPVITVTGTPGADVDYTVTDDQGNVIVNSTVTIDAVLGTVDIPTGSIIDTTIFILTNATLTSTTGCTQVITGQTAEVDVNPIPTVAITNADNEFCAGDSTLLYFAGTPNTIIYYSVTDPTLVTTSLTPAILNAQGFDTVNTGGLAAGTVYLYNVDSIAFNSVPGCTALVTPLADTTTLTVDPLPTVLFFTPVASVLCFDDSTLLNVTGTPGAIVSYTKDGIAQPDITLDPGGFSAPIPTHALFDTTVFTLTSITNPATGCTQTVTGFSDTIYVNPLPIVTITALGPTTFCNGGSVTLSCDNLPGAGIFYQWFLNGVSLGAAANGQTYVATLPGIYNVYYTSGCADSAAIAVTVTVNPLPVATITPAGPSQFCNGDNLLLQANVGANLSYQWYNGPLSTDAIAGATTSSLLVTTAADYHVDVTDGNGCLNSSLPNTVTVNPIPTVTISWVGGAPALTFCAGNSLTLTTTVNPIGGTYEWYRNGVLIATTSAIIANVSGDYVVRYISLSNCSDSSNHVVITVNPLPATLVTTLGPTTICPSDFVVIQANVVAGDSYIWMLAGVPIVPAATDPTYVTNIPGDYTVQITNSFGCIATSAPPVTVVISTPVATITTVTSTTFCNGDSVVMTANAGTAYQWSQDGSIIPGATNATYTAHASGTFSVTVTNVNNCSAESTPTVVTMNPAPVANVTPVGPLTVCQGSSIILSTPGGPGYSFQWFNAATGLIVGAVDSFYAMTGSETDSVVVTNLFGCTDTSAAVTGVLATLPTAAIVPPLTPIICSGGSVILDGSTLTPTDTYQWQLNGVDIPGANAAQYTVTIAGSYAVVVTNVAGCSATSAAVAIGVIATPVVTTQSATTFCWGGSATLYIDPSTIVPGLQFQWQINGNNIPGATNETYPTGQGGLYTCIVSVPGLCSAFSTYITVTENPLPVPLIFPNGSTLTTGTYVTYQWYENNQPIAGATSQSVNITSNGNYYVGVTDSNGCQAISDVYVLTDLDVNDINAIIKAVKVYPNPATSIVNIESPVKVNATLSGMEGKVIIQKNDARELDVSNLPNAVYVITLYDTAGQLLKIQKVVKTN